MRDKEVRLGSVEKKILECMVKYPSGGGMITRRDLRSDMFGPRRSRKYNYSVFCQAIKRLQTKGLIKVSYGGVIDTGGKGLRFNGFFYSYDGGRAPEFVNEVYLMMEPKGWDELGKRRKRLKKE